jgi:hypothetical protein
MNTQDTQVSSWNGYRELTDLLGTAGSALCIAHCIALPFIVSYLPLLGLGFLAEEATHRTLVLVMLLVAASAFIPGYRVHRKRHVLAWMAVGLGSLFFAAFWADKVLAEAWETPFTMIGGACLVTAHLKNRTFCRLCRACCESKSVCGQEKLSAILDPGKRRLNL